MRTIQILIAILALTSVNAFSQGTIEGRVAEEELGGRPAVVQAQGTLALGLEGPVDPNTYVLGPSDQLLLILKGPETKFEFLRVFPEGNVILPNYGAFGASGLTLAEFRDGVRGALGKYYRNVEIECQLSVPRSMVVFVLGQVEAPGPVQMTALSRVSHALEAAGGAPRGTGRLIEIRENGETVRKVDLFKFWRLGEFEQNPTLREGQTVFVKPKEAEVRIVGAVHIPGPYEIIAGETAGDLIRYSGGITPLGDRDQILIERIEDGKPLPVHTFSFDEAETVELRDMDVIVVKDIMSYGGVRPVQVVGGGGRSGRFYVSQGQTLRSFLLRLGAFEPNLDLEAAVIERKTGEGLNSKQIRFNMRDVIAGGPEGEMAVEPGDIIVIPPVEANVYVAGEVRNPGVVPFKAGLTASRYITLAGGPTDAGSINKIKIYSREGVARGGNGDSPVHRGDVIVVREKTSRIFGRLFVGFTSLTGLVLSVIALVNATN